MSFQYFSGQSIVETNTGHELLETFYVTNEDRRCPNKTLLNSHPSIDNNQETQFVVANY